MLNAPSLNIGKLLSYVTSISVVVFAALWAYYYEISIIITVSITVIVTVVRILGEYKPFLLAFAYTKRDFVSYVVLLVSFLFSFFLFYRFPIPDSFSSLLPGQKAFPIAEIIVQGMLVGVLGRIMLLNQIASMIRVNNLVNAKIFVHLSFIVILLLFPASSNHIWLSSIYVLGCGIGFFLHYLLRPREQKKRVYKRFKSRILSAAKTVNVSEDEKNALKLFVDRKWIKLEKFIQNNHNPSTELIDLMQLSCFHAQGKYSNALDKLGDIEKSKIATFNHFHYLHTALNESEKFDHKKDWKNIDVIKDSLDKAIKINPDCMMTNANSALYLVYQKQDSTQAAEEALGLIWKAIKEYENNEDGSLSSLITGMGVPVTYAYLLNIYAYVLLKSGKTRFARHFLFQCLYLDPNHAATYLHLAEYYCILRDKFKNEFKTQQWEMTARICLHIAKRLEKKKLNINGGSLVYNRAHRMLNSLDN